jgi:hypothetical protein
MDIEIIGGFVHTVPTQAAVNTFTFPDLFLEVTSTAGTGFSMQLPLKAILFINSLSFFKFFIITSPQNAFVGIE